MPGKHRSRIPFCGPSNISPSKPPCVPVYQVRCQLPYLADHVAHSVPMRYPSHTLIDDGPAVQVRGGVVRGGANYLHAAVMGSVVGLSTCMHVFHKLLGG